MKNIISRLGIFLVIFGFVFLPSTAFAAEKDSETDAGPQWEYVDGDDIYIVRPCVVSFNGMIYIVGGFENHTTYLTRTTVYNPKTNEFRNTSETSFPRYAASSVVYDGKIYCFGGFNMKQVVDTVEIFDPRTETWTVADTVMPTAKSEFSSAVVGDKIYLIGGHNEDGTGICSVDIYDPKTNTWDTGASMSSPEKESGCTVLQNKIYIFGGRDWRSGNETVYNKISCYDPESDSWTNAGCLPSTTYLTTVSSYNNKAIIIGGTVAGASSPTDKTYIYDPVTQTCTEGPKLQTYKCANISAVVGNTVYVIHGLDRGDNNENAGTTIEKLNLSQLIPSPPVSQNLTVLLNTDETIQLSVSNNLADNTDLTWTSTDSSVAQVDEDGKVTAIASGECSIAVEGSGDAYQEFIPVKVFDGNADQYRLAVNLKPEQTAKLHLTQDPTSTTWTSHDTAVATVNSNGKVTAVSDGLVIIEGKADSESHHIYVRVKI